MNLLEAKQLSNFFIRYCRDEILKFHTSNIVFITIRVSK